jgi:hypothetical protein
MEKKRTTKITYINSISQFEKIYLARNDNDYLDNISPYDFGVTLANQTIEKFTTAAK